MKTKKIAASLLLICIIMSSVKISYAANVTLSISAVEQTYSLWCWAACSEMSGKYYYNYKTGDTSSQNQNSVVVNEYGYPYNYTGSPQQIETGCEYAAYDDALCNASDVAASATFSNIVGFINLSKPTIACIYSPNGNHAVLIYGYNNDNGNTKVNYINPASEYYLTSNYADFTTDVKTDGSWDDTIAWY